MKLRRTTLHALRTLVLVTFAVGAAGCTLRVEDVDDDTAEAHAGPPAAAAQGVTITQIAMLQSIKSRVMDGGSPVAPYDVPIVAGRSALMRIYYQTDTAYDGLPLTARLTIDGVPLEVPSTGLHPASSDEVLDSTINVSVPGEMIRPEMRYRVELLQGAGRGATGNAGAVYPRDAADEALHAVPGKALQITLVPVAYGGDGSGRLPDVSDETLERYRQAFLATYPIAAVDLTVREAVSFHEPIAADGTGWGAMLDFVADLREADGASLDRYYYGIFQPSPTFWDYCQSSCVSGLGYLAGPVAPEARVAVGLGFPGQDAIETAIHELGHNHGRTHAPCGSVQEVDSAFPHQGAAIGTWGYDFRTGELLAPQDHVDLMSYCSPVWVSDYTFKGIYDRLQLVADIAIPKEMQNRTYDRVRIEPDGSLAWLSPVTLRSPPAGESTLATIETDTGAQHDAEGQLLRYNHIEGGVVYLPQGERGPIRALALPTARGVRSLRR